MKSFIADSAASGASNNARASFDSLSFRLNERPRPDRPGDVHYGLQTNTEPERGHRPALVQDAVPGKYMGCVPFPHLQSTRNQVKNTRRNLETLLTRESEMSSREL